MDIINPHAKRQRRRRTLAWWSGGILALTAVLVSAMSVGPSLPTIERANAWIDTVQSGDMLSEVRAPGTLVPRDIRWLATETPAQIAKIEVFPGTAVTADTVLLRLSSPQTETDLRNAQAQVAVAEAQLAAKRVDLQSQMISARSVHAQAQADYAMAEVKERAEANAVALQAIPRVQYEQEAIALKQLKYRMDVEKQRVDTFAANVTAQLAAAQAGLQQDRSNLELRQRQADALNVRAGIAGVVQSVAVQEGQQVAAGVALARVARTDVLIARLRVPEILAKDVALGMPAQVDTYNGVIAGTVSRIDSAVVDGSVQVEVTPAGALPPGARPDLSVDGRIRIAELKQVLSVGRPAKAEANANLTLFRLDASGSTATRVPVHIGATSIDRAQIEQGLKAGEQVILSDTGQWDGHDKIRVR